MIASVKPSWIVMTDIASSVSAHWRPFATFALTTKPVCHVRDFDRSTVDHRVADHDSRHDVFAISHHGGVGSDASDNQIKTFALSSVWVGKIDSGTREFPLESVAVFREFAVLVTGRERPGKHSSMVVESLSV